MPKTDSTKKRTDTLQALAAEVLKASGVNVMEPTPTATLYSMYADMAKRGKCHRETAKRHIAKAMRRARGEIIKARGGPRPGAGRPPAKVKVNSHSTNQTV